MKSVCLIVCAFQSHLRAGVGDGTIPPLGEELSAKRRRGSGGEELLHCTMRQMVPGPKLSAPLRFETSDW
jgi:hypothetical protein